MSNKNDEKKEHITEIKHSITSMLLLHNFYSYPSKDQSH